MKRMWAVKNHTRYAAAKSWGRDRDGVHEWLVALKATFDLRPDGEPVAAEDQPAPLIAPVYRGPPGVSSLLYDADLVGAKPTTDVLLNGTAYAPGGRPSTDFAVGLRVGAVRKTLRVRGNRCAQGGLLRAMRASVEPVVSVPLVYERAYGGHDASDPDPGRHRLDLRNPVGRGIAGRGAGDADLPLPNIEYPNGAIDKVGPAGFGPIDSFWSPRLELQGTYDAIWKTGRYPLLPADWDERSRLCAPRDQLPTSHLHGGEPVELMNLTPNGRLAFVLPKVYPRFRTRLDGRVTEHSGFLSSVIIEPDLSRLTMVWQASLAVTTPIDDLEETIVTEKGRPW